MKETTYNILKANEEWKRIPGIFLKINTIKPS